MPQSLFVQGLDAEVIGDVADIQTTLANITARFNLPASTTTNKKRVAAQPWRGQMLCDIPSGDLHRQGILPPASALYIDALSNAITDAYADDIGLSHRGQSAVYNASSA